MVREGSISPDPIATLAFDQGAVATSVTTRRRWQSGAGEMHHLIDPSSGRPHQNGVVLATTLAPDGWLAEIMTKSLLTGSSAPRPLDSIPALVLRDDGATTLHGAMASYLS